VDSPVYIEGVET